MTAEAPLRIAIIGSCQVVGLAAAARGLLPQADIEFWHVGVHPNDSDEDLLSKLPTFNLILSQISDWDNHIPLSISRLREANLPVVFIPTLVFAGFHPDITYIRGPAGLINGVGSDYHSIIVAASFVLGVAESRVTALFNSFVFARLGYFDVFDAARVALFESFDKIGFDLRPLFESWMQEPFQFMYTINHPHILPLTAICRLALIRAGVLDSGSPLPQDIEDYLQSHFIWPTYPALAKRIGVPASTTFLRRTQGLLAGEDRAMELNSFVTASYRLYQSTPKDTLNVGVVATACERLRAIIVD